MTAVGDTIVAAYDEIDTLLAELYQRNPDHSIIAVIRNLTQEEILAHYNDGKVPESNTEAARALGNLIVAIKAAIAPEGGE